MPVIKGKKPECGSDACSSSTQDAETGESRVAGHTGLHSQSCPNPPADVLKK